MFFTLSKTPDTRFELHESVGDWVFSHDAGWHAVGSSWFKGYRDLDGSGNWAEIRFEAGRISLHTSQPRSFPLWWDKSCHRLTNLLGAGEQIWVDQKVCLNGLDLESHLDDSYQTTIHTDTITLCEAGELICKRLIDKAQNLINSHANLPRKLFLTGGIDTLTLYSLVKHLDIQFDTLSYEFVHYDWFLDQNLQDIKQRHWAYGQIHHWHQPTLLISGACGDEFMFRGPTTIALWAAWHDIDIVAELDDHQGYHVGYFKKNKNLEIFKKYWQQGGEIKILVRGLAGD